MAREASLQELMVASFESQMSNIFTSIPCIVVGVDLVKATVDIQPTINQRLPDGTVEQRPTILSVPISFPASSTAAFTFPIEVGTTGMAIFSMRDMEGWLGSNGRPTTPLTDGRMDKNDAIFLPGIQPPSITINNPQKRVLTHDVHDAVLVNNIGTGFEVEVRLKANGNLIMTTSSTGKVEINCKNSVVNASQSADITAPTVTLDATDIAFYGNVTHNGNWSGTGSYTFNGIHFNSHRHTGVQSGSGTSGGPTN